MAHYFTFKEFIRTSVGIDNYPYSKKIQDNIQELIMFMDLLRIEWTDFCNSKDLGSGAIIITSGYRCEEVNEEVGGAKNSAHLIGSAVDFKPANGEMKLFQEFVIDYLKDKDFDQLIIERIRNGVATWLHLGLKDKKGQMRKQILFFK